MEANDLGIPEDEFELAEDLQDLLGDPVFANADVAELNELIDETAAWFAN